MQQFISDSPVWIAPYGIIDKGYVSALIGPVIVQEHVWTVGELAPRKQTSWRQLVETRTNLTFAEMRGVATQIVGYDSQTNGNQLFALEIPGHSLNAGDVLHNFGIALSAI